MRAHPIEHIENRETEYLIFEFSGESPSGKTLTYDVLSRRTEDLLGTIGWFGRWRQYAFFPKPDTVFNTGCLADIREFTADLMAARRQS